MTNPPVPCAHCGTNFMRRDLNPDAPKLCNNCEYNNRQREQNRINNKEKSNSQIQLLITCDRSTQIEVEEICMNQGLSISEYFIRMHKIYAIPFIVKPETEEGFEKLKKMTENFHGKLEWLPDDMKEIHEQFEGTVVFENPPSFEMKISQSAIDQEKKDREGFGEGKYKMEHQEALLPVNKVGIRGQNTLANVKFKESPKTKKRKK